MNKSAIKKFAVQARKQLINEIDQKAYEIGIENDKIHELKNNAQIHGRTLNSTEIDQRNKLINEIKAKGYEQVIDEVAYTWFNRFVALRFMEVNGYLPTGVRVLSSKTEGKIEPDIIQEALNIDLDIDEEKIYQFEDHNDTNGLYRYLLIKQCNSLNDIMPFIFEKIADYTEILLPNNLLKEDSVIRNMVDDIDNEDWQDVEIIGWLYQYYISDKKDEVIQAKKKYKKEEIPYATQLFTPDWIVRYMVQNSLGRYWLESHPEDDDLKDNWEYYLENQDPDPEALKELEQYLDRTMQIEEVKVFDPACGSGHILVYVFDVLYHIYQKAGYLQEQIPKLIIENNLYGLEIDDRAYQLSCLSIIMKALEYNKKILNELQDNNLKINIASIQETNNLNEEDINYLEQISDYDSKKIRDFITSFKDAKIFGSLIELEEFDEKLLESLYKNLMSNYENNIFKEHLRRNLLDILPKLIKQYQLMSENQYDIV
ncbi:MAG: BREX-1 system adenine-specific DNA-methyltransferase PglX, partial [bacterium]